LPRKLRRDHMCRPRLQTHYPHDEGNHTPDTPQGIDDQVVRLLSVQLGRTSTTPQ
jgi:hypothetical protein